MDAEARDRAEGAGSAQNPAGTTPPGTASPISRRQLTAGVRALFPRRGDLAQQRLPLLGCLLSGLCGGLVFPPVEAGWLAHFALVPLLLALPRLSGPLIFWGPFLAFATLWSYLNLWWLNTLVVFHPAIPFGILLLGAIVGLFLMPFCLGARIVIRRWPGWLIPLGIACAWTGSEQLRHLGETAFPWNLLGHTQISGPTAALAQWAEIGGVPFVGFLVALTNGLVAYCVLRWIELRAAFRAIPPGAPDDALQPLQKRAVLAVLDALWTLLAVFFFFMTATAIDQRAQRHHDYRAGREDTARLRVGLVQSSVSLLEKMREYDLQVDRRRRHEAADRYIAEALRLGAEVAATSPPLDLLVFPEAMFVDPMFVFDPQMHTVVERYSRELKVEMLFGADGWEEMEFYRRRLRAGRIVPKPDEPLPRSEFPQLQWSLQDDGTTAATVDFSRYARFVSVYQVRPDTGLMPQVYHKIQLVPFGEHAPLLDWLPFNLAERLLWVAAFQKGTIAAPFESHGVRIGPMICFESTFARLARQQAQAGARVLAVMTNDAWYDPAYAKAEGGVVGFLFGLPVLSALAAPGPDQHLIHSRFRAIETRLPVVRAANRGRSAVILPTGRFAPGGEPLPFGVRGTIAAEVAVPTGQDYAFRARRRSNYTRYNELVPAPALTAYVRRGDWAGWGAGAVLLATLLVPVLRRRKSPV